MATFYGLANYLDASLVKSRAENNRVVKRGVAFRVETETWWFMETRLTINVRDTEVLMTLGDVGGRNVIPNFGHREWGKADILFCEYSG